MLVLSADPTVRQLLLLVYAKPTKLQSPAPKSLVEKSTVMRRFLRGQPKELMYAETKGGSGSRRLLEGAIEQIVALEVVRRKPQAP